MDSNAQIRKMLEDAIKRKKEQKSGEDFKQVAEGIAKEISSSISSSDISNGVVDRLSAAIEPVLTQILEKDRATSADIVAAIQAIKMEVPQVQMPEMKAPIVNIPAPVVHVPAPIVNIPAVKFPEPLPFPTEFSIKDVNPKKPFPVTLMDAAGKPYYPGMSGGATGGRGDFFTIAGFNSSVGAALIDSGGVQYSSSNPFPVTITSGGSATSASNIVDSTGVAYTGSNPLPVTITSGASATSASMIVDSSGVAYSGSNPIPTTATITLPSGPGDGATATRFIQAGDTISSTNVISFNSNTPATGLNETTNGVLRVVQMSDSVSSVVVNSGTITAVTNITNSIAAVLVDGTGLSYTGSNPMRTIINSGTVTVGSITASSAVTLTDSGGVSYSGSNPLPTILTGPLAQGDSSSAIRVVQAGDAAVSSQAIMVAMTTLPTAVADGASVSQKSDKLGRTLSRPINVRDLIATARAQSTTSAETTLATASAGQFLDLISVLFANQSTNAISVDIRALVGGNIEQTIEVPATATAGWTPPVPWPMGNSGNAWTYQLSTADQSNTTLTGNALFTKES